MRADRQTCIQTQSSQYFAPLFAAKRSNDENLVRQTIGMGGSSTFNSGEGQWETDL